jgi:hypothetical protein
MPQKLFIPNLGTLIMLAEEWTFKLYFERRNDGMLTVFGTKKGKYWWRGQISGDDFIDGVIPACVEYEKAMTEDELASAYKSFAATNARDNPFIRVTLPKGTQLKLDRIYVKRGAESFASVTFRTTKICPNKLFTSKRFWVKLREANQIVADVIG